MKRQGLFLLLLVQILLPGYSLADVVYPARLEMNEVEPAVFSVRFNLPMINNRRLRAEPILPSLCRDTAEKEIRINPNDYVEIRRVSCPPDLLFGETIAVKGLIGTQVDVILFLDMLDGRSYTATLKPAKAIFVIPHPPSLLDFVNFAGLAGVRRIVTRPEIFLLLFLMVFLRIRRKNLFLVGCGLIIGYAAGQYLFQQKWLQFSSQLLFYVLLIAVLLPSLDFLRLNANSLRWLRPFMFFGFLAGLLFGGSIMDPFLPAGLSTMETGLAFVIHAAGIILGLLLGYFLMVELHRILCTFPIPAERRNRFFGYLTGTLATACILYHFSTLMILPSIIPEAPPEFYVLAISVGLWLGLPDSFPKIWVSLLLIPFAAGMYLGHSGITLPIAAFCVSGTLFLSGMAIMTGRLKSYGFSIPVLTLALLYHGWNSAAFIEENLSLPIAVSLGSATVGILLVLLARNAVIMGNWRRGMPIVRIAGGAIMIFALVLRIGDYTDWYRDAVAGEMIMGYVRIPVLTLVLLATALFFWPRRRRVQEMLNIQTQKPILHWVLLFLCCFMLPYGTVRLRNVLHEPSAPTGDNARHILTQILSNTYHAFNLEDEELLYNQLSETIGGDLVENVYLDSRRKLTSGVRQGAEVTVREVRVVSVGGEVKGSNAVEGFTYECKWSVTARVRHLQHVHYRQNIYTGLLRVQAIGDAWKIGAIDLISEDRVIIPWSSG